MNPDPRFEHLDDHFRDVIDQLSKIFVGMARARRGRVFHFAATTALGRLQVLPRPDVPAHAFFVPGKTYPVLLRHANGVAADDAAWDNRGATVRVLHPEQPDRFDTPLLDLLLSTGECFGNGTAEEFLGWMRADTKTRERIARRAPHISKASWDAFRAAESYLHLHYHSKVVSHFRSADGEWFVRYRLLPPDKRADSGFLDTGGKVLPPDQLTRPAGDTRSATFLHEEFRAQVQGGGATYLLQVQLHPVSSSDAENDAALDCSRPWPHDEFPWRDVATLHLDTLVDDSRITPLQFNPFNAPPELGMVLATSATERASLNHARSIIYERAAAARLPRNDTQQQQQRRVAVIGGGPSGLTAARELERLGVAVTVFEADADVAGKASAVQIGGHWFDLGCHVCSLEYRNLEKVLESAGVAKEPVSKVLIWDVEKKHVAPRQDPDSVKENYVRYRVQLRRQFSEIARSPLSRYARQLSQPIASWLQDNHLDALGKAVGLSYTSAGYGYLDDPDLPVLYWLKYAELAIFCMDPDKSDYWTTKGGFLSLWQKVAATLRDVRCGTPVESVRRDTDKVVIQANGEQFEFDEVVIATPLQEALRFLDASAEERDLFSRIRWYDYYTVIVSAENLPQDGFFLVKQHCFDSSKRGHTVAFHHRYPDSDVYLFYCYGGPGIGTSEIERFVREDVAQMGGRVTTLHQIRPWAFFPHVTSGDIEAGFFERVDALQGRNRTCYLGSVLNFELAEYVVEYAQQTVERFFGKPKPAQPTAAPAATPIASPPPPNLVPVLTGLNAMTARAEMIANRAQTMLHGVKEFEAQTAAALAAPVRGYSIRPTTLLAPIYARAGAQPPAYVIHGLDGGITFAMPIASLLAADGRPVVAVQPVGTLGQEAPLERVEEMAARYCREIELQQPEGPYNLIGASMGGMIVFEMAQLFRQKGAQVSVNLVDTVHPNVWRAAWASPEGLSTFGRLFFKPIFNIDVQFRPEEFTGLDVFRTFERVVQSVDASGLMQPFQQRKWQLFQALFRAASRYEPRYYPDQMVLYVAMEERGETHTLEHLGWAESVKSIVRIDVPGDHVHVSLPPHVSVLASHMRRFLLNATSPRPGTTAMDNHYDPQRDLVIQMVRGLSAASARLEMLAAEAQAVLRETQQLEAQVINALRGGQVPMAPMAPIAPVAVAPPPAPAYVAPPPVYVPPAPQPSGRQEFVRYLQELLAAELQLGTPPAPDLEFTQMGIDSVRSVELLERLYNDKGMTLAPTVLLEYPTIDTLASYLAAEAGSGRTAAATY